jgi:hypothetical protein
MTKTTETMMLKMTLRMMTTNNDDHEDNYDID